MVPRGLPRRDESDQRDLLGSQVTSIDLRLNIDLDVFKVSMRVSTRFGGGAMALDFQLNPIVKLFSEEPFLQNSCFDLNLQSVIRIRWRFLTKKWRKSSSIAIRVLFPWPPTYDSF